MGSMNPQQPQQQSPVPPAGSSLDYLNQIAPTTTKTSLFGIKGPLKPIHYIFAGLVGLLVIVLIVSIVANSASSGNTGKMQHLAARLTTTATIVNSAEANLKDGKLKTLNSNLKLFLTNTNRDIVAPFGKLGVNTNKLPKSIVTSEAATDVSARLEDARLNAVYDSTYAREMSYQLATTLSLMKEIYSSTKNKEAKDFLETAYSNLQPTQQAFADFTATTE
jgi:hypothetical protein